VHKQVITDSRLSGTGPIEQAPWDYFGTRLLGQRELSIKVTSPGVLSL